MEAGAATVTTPPAAPPLAATGTAPAPTAPASTPPASAPAPSNAQPAGASPGAGLPPPDASSANLLATDNPVEGNTGAQGTEAPKPVPVELKLPEGFKETPALAQFKTLAGEVGLKSESAQKIFDVYQKAQAEQQEAQVADWKQQQTKWVESLKADKDFGGQAFDANIGLVKRAINKFATPELRELFNNTWVGNHPAVVRLLHAVGKTLSEDTVAGTSGASGIAPTKEEQLKALYPTHFKKD